jgi:hypothetical protein
VTGKATTRRRVPSASRTGWVPIALMRVSEVAQRDLRPSRVDELAKDFDPEKIGVLVVNKRDGLYWIIDGQHRKEVLKAVGWGDQQVQCEIYEGLTEAEEAEMFLGRNDNLAVTSLAKFKVAVVAGRPDEVAIDKIVRSEGLRIGSGAGVIQAVGTLTRVYDRFGADTLARSLAVIRDSYGTPGMEAAVIEAVAMVLHRYSEITNDTAVSRLGSMRGGIGAVMTTAEQLRNTTAYPKPQCIAAAIVTSYNRARGGRKVAPWFRAEQDSTGTAA